jgi:hypothetical protein
MSTLEDLETQLVSSRKVREFLKNFSETQWARVVKASVIMGIQELERSQQVTKLSAKDLEDLVGKSAHFFTCQIQSRTKLKFRWKRQGLPHSKRSLSSKQKFRPKNSSPP